MCVCCVCVRACVRSCATHQQFLRNLSSQGLGPLVTPSETESNDVAAAWTFKMTSKVGFVSGNEHLPTGV
jgi:hypothetical protein